MISDYTKTGIFDNIQKLLDVNVAEISQAAAIALGDITTQNPGFYLQKLFASINSSNDHRKFMYLQTLKEIIFNKPASLEKNINDLVSLYLDQSNSQNVNIKSTISESIGTLFRA